jgi:hypothetical protein
MLAFATQLMPRRDAPMRALAANAGAHFPLIVRSRFCLCLWGSAFLPFAKEFFQISQCITGTGSCSCFGNTDAGRPVAAGPHSTYAVIPHSGEGCEVPSH